MCLATDSYAAQNLTSIQEQARLYRELGLELQKEGKLQEALVYYHKAILLDPQYVITYNDAGIILEALGDREAAKAAYLKGIEVAPDYAETYSNLAILYEEEGNYTDAVTCWMKRATLGAPDDPWAEAARRRIGDIAQAYPEAYGVSSQQYQKGPGQPLALEKETPQAESRGIEVAGLSLPESPAPAAAVGPPKETFEETEVIPRQVLDNKTRAFNYLTHAKENFARGQYVAALKEATVAEYLDPDNSEISSFVEQVRKKLLQ